MTFEELERDVLNEDIFYLPNKQVAYRSRKDNKIYLVNENNEIVDEFKDVFPESSGRMVLELWKKMHNK